MRHTTFWGQLVRWSGTLVILLTLLAGRTAAQGPDSPTAFSYEGRLADSAGNAANGPYDFEFKLFDALIGGSQVGETFSRDNLPVNAGQLRVELDFGSGVFTGPARYLEIALRPANSFGPYTVIAPRRKLTAVPYALALPNFWIQPNATSPNLIGGYSGNHVTLGVLGATISGGGAENFTNRVTDDFGVISGGRNNQAGDNAGSSSDNPYTTIGGGVSNTAGRSYATVSGGWLNTADGLFSAIGGGSQNNTGNIYATIGGGLDNNAGGVGGTVGGGWLNGANNIYSTISGGYNNKANEVYASVGGGSYNRANGSWAIIGGGYNNGAGGAYSVIPGGKDNLAQGDYSFAAGYGARANGPGCFVWADATGGELSCQDQNCFVARASGGVYFYTSSDLSAGARLPAGSGAWSTLSDGAAKANLEPVDGQEILARLAGVPIQSWNYTTQDPSIRHIGPAAQDFQAAFGLGEDNRHISTVDADGVALAAIQGLYELTQTQKAQIEALQGQNADLEARLAALEKLVNGSETQ
ncbi:MAG: tail fiber domain-containing protein [Anaerolineae bacterium]